MTQDTSTRKRHALGLFDGIAADYDRFGALRYAFSLRPGVPELLAETAARGIPLAVVSNTLCGAVHRDFLAAAGLGDRFAVQLYSDEVGVRKPNPELIRRAASAVKQEMPRIAPTCWRMPPIDCNWVFSSSVIAFSSSPRIFSFRSAVSGVFNSCIGSAFSPGRAMRERS